MKYKIQILLRCCKKINSNNSTFLFKIGVKISIYLSLRQFTYYYPWYIQFWQSHDKLLFLNHRTN